MAAIPPTNPPYKRLYFLVAWNELAGYFNCRWLDGTLYNFSKRSSCFLYHKWVPQTTAGIVCVHA